MILRGSARYLEIVGGLRPVDYLMLNLLRICNYNCPKCCTAVRRNPSGEPLSLDEIASLFEQSQELGIRVLVIAGEGEPLLDPLIGMILEAATRHDLIPYLFTNGSFMTAPVLRSLERRGASVIVNLDYLDQAQYERHSGFPGSFAAVMENLEQAREIFASTHELLGGYEVRRIGINTVVSSANISQLEAIRSFCAADFVWVANSPISAGRAWMNFEYEPSLEIERAIERFSDGLIPFGTTADGHWCAYMRNGITVGYDGTVLVCPYALGTNGFGNVRERPLADFVGVANQAVNEFYEVSVHSRCILRHPHYDKFRQGG